MIDHLIINMKVSLWEDLDSVKHAISKGYTRPRNPELYTLTAKNWKHYELYIDYYCESDVEGSYTIEDVTTKLDSVGFWAYTNEPIKELALRILSFKAIAQDVLGDLGDNTTTTLNTLPTNPSDSHFDKFLIAWVNSIDPSLLQIPSDYEEAMAHIELLQYKYRKMVELFTVFAGGNVSESIFNYFQNNC